MNDQLRNKDRGRPGNGGGFTGLDRPEGDFVLGVQPLEGPVDWAALDEEGGTWLPGEHPVYGGGAWGITYSEHWAEYNVTHGHGVPYLQSDPAVLVSRDGSQHRIPDTEVLWMCHTDDGADAAAIWQHRDDITRALQAAGCGTKRVRIGVELDEGQFVVTDYDYQAGFDPIVIPRRH